MKTFLAAALLAFASKVSATLEGIPEDHILYGPGGKSGAPARVERRATSTQASVNSCTNGPLTRSCWSSGYSVATDFDQKWPSTGATKSYQFTITNTTCNPDGGASRQCLLINNQLPGPTITANWGDMISVTVTNNMQNNGTAIHWHGARQLNSNAVDGVGGITQCPIAPGQSQTYTFQATQFGSTWYHSHTSAQYGDGIFGALVINGPASDNYDIDLGPVLVQDWYYRTAWQIDDNTNVALQKGGPGPSPDNVLINGLNKNSVNSGGSYSKFTFTPGKKHLLRVANVGVDNALRFSIDNHQLTVVTSDLVPVKPITTDSILLGIGQRYNVIVEANQTAGNYWMRAHAENACDSGNSGYGYAIVSYSGTTVANPKTSSTETSSGCAKPGTLTPWVPNTVGSASAFQSQASSLNVNIDQVQTTTNGQNIVVWGVNMTGIDVSWDNPTLSYVQSGNTSYPQTYNLISLPNEGIWSYWIIQEVQGGPASIWHPIHLHGHDFYELGSGTGTFNLQTDPANLQYNNPTRRDTALLPAGGWLVLAWPTDNPGAWLLHCHIAWHISEGLGVQFLESVSTMNVPSSMQSQCSTWQSYSKTAAWPEPGSGLKRRVARQF